MSKRLILSVYAQTREFHKFYKLFFLANKMAIYAREDRYGNSYVVIYARSRKSFVVLFGDGLEFARGGISKSEYNRFGTQWEVCRYLDSIT